MFRASTLQRSNDASARSQLRKVRKGTRSCWECRRRKIRCTSTSGNTDKCDWCLSHEATCISQRYADTASDSVNPQTWEERVVRVEGLLERLLRGIEAKDVSEHEPSSHPISIANVTDSIGVDVIDPTSGTSDRPCPASVVSIFQNSMFQSQMGVPSLADSSLAARYTTGTTGANNPRWISKIGRVSRLLLTMMPPREAIEAIDEESSPWIRQLLRALPSFQRPGGFSLLRIMPLESSSPSHPTMIARALMCVVVCLQQLPKGFDFAKLGPLPQPVGELAESLTEAVCASVTSDDEIVATPEGIECLILQTIFFINSGKPRRAWLSNRRALAVAQLMGLHVHDEESLREVVESRGSELAGPWQYIVHSDRFLALVLGVPNGAPEPDTQSPDPLRCLDETQRDMIYLKHLDRIAARIIDREQSSISLAFIATQSIDDALEELSQSMPESWWQEDMDKFQTCEPEALSKVYNRLNIQVWHHQLALTLHLPFLLDPATHRKHEYSRFSCLHAARGLIKRYLVIRSTFGMFSCCLTNFQAFTAAAILIFNLFRPNPTFATENLQSQKEADWTLVGDVIEKLDQSSERFQDTVAMQASDVLKLLRRIMQEPQNQAGDNFKFTIPYFGIINITRKPNGQGNDSAPTETLPDYSSMFMATINTSQLILPSGDELLQQWLVDEVSW